MSTTATVVPAVRPAATCTPATSEPVDVTGTARALGMDARWRVVLAAGAHDRARALSKRPETEEGVTEVVEALGASLSALGVHQEPLSVGTAWTIRTGHTFGTRWTVLVTADELHPAGLVLYLIPA